MTSSLTITTCTSELLSETKPVVVFPTISQTSTIQELISHLKSSYRDTDFSRVEEILTNREAQLRTEIRNLKRERDSAEKGNALTILEKVKLEEQMEELKAEKDEIEAKLKCYQLKYEGFNSRMSRMEEEIAKSQGMDISMVQKMIEELDEENDEAVEVNLDGNGNSGVQGSVNMDFVSNETNLSNGPGAETLHSMPSTIGSSQLNRSVCNIESVRCHSDEADHLPANLASKNAAPIIDLSESEANTVSGRPGSSNTVHIIDSDDERRREKTPYVSDSYGVGRNLPESSALLSRRKRLSSETRNSDGSSFGRQKTRSTRELNRDGKLPLEPKTEFIKHYDHSPLSLRACKLNGISDDSSDSDDDPCSDKNMDLLFKKVEEGKRFSTEDDLRSSFEKDVQLCMQAVCALYRQQIKGLSSAKSRGLSQSDKYSITILGEYLIDGDPENKLKKTVKDVQPKYHEQVKRLAIEYCHQLYEIYVSMEDFLFCPGVVFSNF